jgi:hypothetical protein
MRADMTPEEVRAAGVYLNGGRRRGWKRRLSALLDTPEATVSAWSTRSRGNARPISGAAAVAIKLLLTMMRQELMATARPSQAGDAVFERVMAFRSRPDPILLAERSITIGSEQSLPGVLQIPPRPARLRPATPGGQRLEIQAPRPPDAPLPFGAKPRGGQPGSSA